MGGSTRRRDGPDGTGAGGGSRGGGRARPRLGSSSRGPVARGPASIRRGETGFGLVETLVALVVLTAGLLGVAGLTTTVAEQTRRSSWETEQALVAQQVMDSIRQAGYAAASDGTDTLSISGRQWAASWTVTKPVRSLKKVDVEVQARGDLGARTFAARLHRPVALSAAKPPQTGGGGGT